MTTKIHSLILGLFLLWSHCCNAQFVDGNQLHEWSLAKERVDANQIADADSFNAAIYMGYVTGVYEARHDSSQLRCAPGGKRGQIFAIVTKYLKNNPERWNDRGDTLVLEAISQAFPCKPSKDKS